jgi:broad specificity phosphatase PhoE
MSSRIVLIRHARIAAGHEGRLIGSTDVPLGPEGERQAAWLAGRVGRWSPGRCFASPMLRCRQTAAAMFASMYPAPGTDTQRWSVCRREQRHTECAGYIFDPDLREIDFGQCEDRTFQEIARDDPSLAARWAAFEPDFAFPGGDSIGGFVRRVCGAADRLAAEPAETVLAVAHGGVIRAMICHFLGLEMRNYVLFEVAYAATVVIDLFDGPTEPVGKGGQAPRKSPSSLEIADSARSQSSFPHRLGVLSTLEPPPAVLPEDCHG